MVDRLVNSEANTRRIALVESCFGNAGQPLTVPGRVLVGEGILTKACRKKPKPRQFFLFNDLLVYGNIILNKKKYNKQHIIPLEDVKLQTLEDDGLYRNGWLICTRGKSFAVYAATATEKQEWMAHIDKCIRDLLQKSGKTAASEHAAVWVPDSEANTCMVCRKSQFTIMNRRHHCRKCGAVVCGACSSRKYLLPSQSSKPLRVCDSCYETLTKIDDKGNVNVTGKRPLSTVHELPEPPIEKPARPPPPKLFPEEPPQEEIHLPLAPSEIPDLHIPQHNPKAYKLVQLSMDDSFDMADFSPDAARRGFMRQNSSSFWWDGNDDHQDQDMFVEDPFPSTISATVYKEPLQDGKPSDSSGEDDSDDEETNGNVEVENDGGSWWNNDPARLQPEQLVLSPHSQLGPLPRQSELS